MKNGRLPAVLKTATLLMSARSGGGNSNGNSDEVTPPAYAFTLAGTRHPA